MLFIFTEIILKPTKSPVHSCCLPLKMVIHSQLPKRIVKSCCLFYRNYIKTHKKSGTFLLLTAQMVMHSQLPKRIAKSCSLFYRTYIKKHKKSGTFLLLTAQMVMHWYLYRTICHCKICWQLPKLEQKLLNVTIWWFLGEFW